MLEANAYRTLLDELDRFNKLKPADFYHIIDLLNTKRCCGLIPRYLHALRGLDQNEVVCRMINAGNGFMVMKELEMFDELNLQDIVVRLIKAGDSKAVLRKFEPFKDLNNLHLVNTQQNVIEDDKGVTRNFYNVIGLYYIDPEPNVGWQLWVLVGEDVFKGPQTEELESIRAIVDQNSLQGNQDPVNRPTTNSLVSTVCFPNIYQDLALIGIARPGKGLVPALSGGIQLN